MRVLLQVFFLGGGGGKGGLGKGKGHTAVRISHSLCQAYCT